jgi:hypothetical protein
VLPRIGVGCGSRGHSHVKCASSEGIRYITPTIFVAFTAVRAYVLNASGLHSNGMSAAAGGYCSQRTDFSRAVT